MKTYEIIEFMTVQNELVPINSQTDNIPENTVVLITHLVHWLLST